ncbi:MAG: hypothetical protein JNM72_25150 [Deltaproteobacteria bacterium]|nr:hypothetical protein [Deltaproteobacteria bacterium]
MGSGIGVMGAGRRVQVGLALVVLAGCEELGGKDDSGGAVPAGEAQDIEAPGTFAGDIANGLSIDLAWAADSSVACWPTTEDVNFDGNHVFFRLSQPEQSVLRASLRPTDGADLSLYLLQFGEGSEQLPPAVSQAVTCEAGYDQTNDSNPGDSEEAAVTATTNAYDVIIGVAGAGGLDAGAFSLQLDLEP